MTGFTVHILFSQHFWHTSVLLKVFENIDIIILLIKQHYKISLDH